MSSYSGTAAQMRAGAAHVERNWARAGIANAVTPDTDPFWFTPAQIALHRLRAVLRADRKACPSGRWVKVRGRGLVVPWQCYMRAYVSGNQDVVEMIRGWERMDKPRYRWRWRR